MVSFPLDIRTELKLGDVWTDVSPDVYVRDAKQISRGVRDQGSAADPSSLAFTLNNRSGKYSVRNAESPLYGLIGRNTQVRVSVPAEGDSYLQLDGDAGSFATTPDTAALDITGDLDVRVEMAPNWYGTENQIVIGKWEAGQASWMVQLFQGWAYLRYSGTGTESVAPSYYHARPLPELPERAALRVTLDVDNGAGAHVVTFSWAPSLGSTTWTPIGAPISGAGTGPIFAGSAPLRIGLSDAGAKGAVPRRPMIGRVYRAEVRNGIDGPVVASPDFRGLADRATSVTDSAGRVWSLAGGAAIRHREDRFVGEISEWPLQWRADESDVWTSVKADGILRRLGQGMKELASTLRRRIPSGNPVAYWPMEESKEATRAYSPIPGVQPAAVSGVDWAAASDLVSSNSLPKLGKLGALSAPVPGNMPSGEWQVEFVYNADDKAPPAAGEYAQVFALSSPNGTVRRWEIGIRKGAARIWGFDSGGTDLAFSAVGIGDDVFHGWTRMRFWAVDDGAGSFTYSLSWQDVGGDAGGHSFTLPGTCGRINAVTANWGALTEGWGFGHLTVLPVSGSTLMDGSDDAFSGETAWERLYRLGVEEKLSIGRIPGELTPQRVGPQRPAKLVDLLEDVARADGGWLTESPRRVGLTYRDRSSAYTQAPALTLSYTSPGMAPDLSPVDDDRAIRNDVTVNRDGGSSGRAFRATGPLSVQAPPLGIGAYSETVTLSLSDDTQPVPMANWLLNLRTYDGARYPVVTVMLHKPGAEALVPQVLALREGDIIRLTNLPKWLSHSDVDLLVQGWDETLDLYAWEVSFNCAPGGPWNTAVVEHDVYAKAGTDGSRLTADVTASDSVLNIRPVAGGLPFTTDPAEMPIPVQLAGEAMSATAISPWLDDFTRTAANGWGTSANGIVWSSTAGSPSDYLVSGGVGVHNCVTKNVLRYTYTPAPSADVDLICDWTVDKTALTDSNYVFIFSRFTDTNHMYFARVQIIGGTQAMALQIRKRNGSETQVGSSFSLVPTFTAGTWYRLRFETTGTTLRAKCWPRGTAEPVAWQITTTDPDLTVPGAVGFRSLIGSTSTQTLPIAVSGDNFEVQSTQRFTVTRAVNGVSKAHVAGESLTLASPAITSL